MRTRGCGNKRAPDASDFAKDAPLLPDRRAFPMHQPDAARHHVIITGTGRTGTTFLVRLGTELGLDTGFNRADWQAACFAHCAAGLERNLADADAPYLVKAPQLCDTLPALLATGRIVIDHAIVPMRDLEQAALSRAHIGGGGTTPGGLWKTADPAAQQAVLARTFHRLMHTLAAHDIPHTLLHFPRLVCDADYTWQKLRFLFPHIAPETFRATFVRVADPAKVHTFTARDIPSDPTRTPAALAHAADERRARRRRRWQRFAGAAFVATAIALPLLRIALPHRAQGGPFRPTPDHAAPLMRKEAPGADDAVPKDEPVPVSEELRDPLTPPSSPTLEPLPQNHPGAP